MLVTHSSGTTRGYADPRGRRWTVGLQGELAMKRSSLRLTRLLPTDPDPLRAFWIALVARI